MSLPSELPLEIKLPQFESIIVSKDFLPPSEYELEVEVISSRLVQKEIEIFENQRYGHPTLKNFFSQNPIESFRTKYEFCKDALLPTDRGAYSTRDGKQSWGSLEEVEKDTFLLTAGLTWQRPLSWEIDYNYRRDTGSP